MRTPFIPSPYISTKLVKKRPKYWPKRKIVTGLKTRYTGLCHHTFHGHLHPVNHASIASRGDLIGSVDSGGHLAVRDIRNGQILSEVSLNCCAHSVNFDPTGEVVGVGLENGAVELVELATIRRNHFLEHQSSVNCVQFDGTGDMIASCSADGTVKIWN